MARNKKPTGKGVKSQSVTKEKHGPLHYYNQATDFVDTMRVALVSQDARPLHPKARKHLHNLPGVHRNATKSKSPKEGRRNSHGEDED